MLKLLIKRITVGDLKTNCYIISTDKNNCLIFDPGSDFDKINNYIIQNKLSPSHIFLTHGHYDHIGAVPKLKESYPEIKIFISDEDKDCLIDGQKSLASVFGNYTQKPIQSDVIIKDNMILKIDDIIIESISAPGHTPGSVCYLINNNILLTGDTLFKDSVGRTDLPGGDQKKLEDSIKKIYKLFIFQNKDIDMNIDMNIDIDKIKIYPGHWISSNLKKEFYSNPYIKFLYNYI
ncbi:MAG: MBL fold metallo-hydrolase [Oscillospiraceae bacterium]|nr:MBL fold metallo-hydrolase [Oscillospiraceae bacterium]